MDEVERPLRERVAANVVSEHFDIRSSDRGEEIELEVRSGHTPVRADEVAEPAGLLGRRFAQLIAANPAVRGRYGNSDDRRLRS